MGVLVCDTTCDTKRGVCIDIRKGGCVTGGGGDCVTGLGGMLVFVTSYTEDLKKAGLILEAGVGVGDVDLEVVVGSASFASVILIEGHSFEASA